MTIKILFSAADRHHQEWIPVLNQTFTEFDLDFDLITYADNPTEIDYLLHSPDGPVNDFTPFANLSAIMTLWAGVEDIINNKTIACPLVRMNDPGMVEGMREWVTGQVLRHHLGMDIHINNRSGAWLKETSPPLARSRVVGFLGLGVLGLACLKAVKVLNFQVMGWSRTKREIPDVQTFHGKDGLHHVLGASDIIAMILPLTRETTDLINRDTLKFIKRGTVLINSGRGGLINEEDLLQALDNGQVSHATLDVFKTEPLPVNHPFWLHDKVSIWPHISSESRPQTASISIARNITRNLKGEAMKNVVDFERGY